MGVAVEGLWLGLTKDPLAMSLMSAAQGNMDVQPVDIHNKICRIFLLPHPYKATILCFSNFVLFQQLLHVCKCPLKGKAFVLGLSLLVSTIWVPHRSVH